MAGNGRRDATHAPRPLHSLPSATAKNTTLQSKRTRKGLTTKQLRAMIEHTEKRLRLGTMRQKAEELGITYEQARFVVRKYFGRASV